MVYHLYISYFHNMTFRIFKSKTQNREFFLTHLTTKPDLNNQYKATNIYRVFFPLSLIYFWCCVCLCDAASDPTRVLYNVMYIYCNPILKSEKYKIIKHIYLLQMIVDLYKSTHHSFFVLKVVFLPLFTDSSPYNS